MLVGKVSLRSGDLDPLVNVALKLDMPSLLVSAIEKSSCGLDLEALRELTRAIAPRDPAPWLPAYVARIIIP